MSTKTVTYVRNAVTGYLEPAQVLRDDIDNNAPLDPEPLVMPRLNFGHAQHDGAGSVTHHHDTQPSNVVTNVADDGPLVMPKCDFSGRVNNGSCGCQPKAKPVANSGGFEGEPLVAPKLNFSQR